MTSSVANRTTLPLPDILELLVLLHCQLHFYTISQIMLFLMISGPPLFYNSTSFDTPLWSSWLHIIPGSETLPSMHRAYEASWVIAPYSGWLFVVPQSLLGLLLPAQAHTTDVPLLPNDFIKTSPTRCGSILHPFPKQPFLWPFIGKKILLSSSFPLGPWNTFGCIISRSSICDKNFPSFDSSSNLG